MSSDREHGESTREKPLADLTDEELEDELRRRRRARGERRSPGTEPRTGSRERNRPSRDEEPASPRRKQLVQYYANLELEPGASLDEAREAYRKLMRKYHPDKHLHDPERHRAAVELAQSLTAAYQAIRRHLEGE